VAAPLDRLTIQEAARLLGISEGAVRKRVKRGTLEHDKAPDGRVYVYLDGGVRGVDDVQDAGVDPNSTALISQLRDEVEYLREESRRKDEIIMQQALTMRQLSAPSEADEPTTVDQDEEEPQGEQHEGQETPAQRPTGVAWWRRIWGR
jgi:excisionase family DNA binding protein